jgi:tight adherence protein B
MDPTVVLLVVFAAVALIVAAASLVLRDLFGRKEADQQPTGDGTALDLATLLPSAETAVGEANESWLGQLVAETKSDFTVETAVLLAILIGLALGGTLFLWRDDWLAGAAGAVAGALFVGGMLLFLRSRRYRAIREQLPDVMELLARAVRAGESLDQAIILAGDSAFQPVATEFRYCASQMKIGLSLESAIRGLVARMPLVETRILAMTLVVQRRRGGNLPATLERLARVFRDRANFIRQFRAATALGRGSAILIALVALGLDAFVILGHSDYTRSLMETNSGRSMLGTAMILQVVGVTWVAWLFRSRTY